MKKLLLGALCAVLLLTVGCSGGSKASDNAVTAAKSAVSIADNYIDNTLSESDARNKLDALEEDMAYVKDLPQDDKNKAGDFSVATGLTVLSSSILTDSISNDSKSHDKVIEARNTLAGYAGEKKR